MADGKLPSADEFQKLVEDHFEAAKTLLKWTDKPPAFDTSFSFENLLSESDRGCLLTAAEFLSDLLEDKIRRKLIELSKKNESDKETRDDLKKLLTNRPFPPIGSYGIRIIVARYLGLIDDPTRKTLAAIQDLRNDGAHSWEAFAFTKAKIEAIEKHLGADYVKWIKDGANYTELFFKKLQGPLAGILARPSRERIEFVWLFTVLLNRLNAA